MAASPSDIEVLSVAARWLAQGRKVALATVVHTSGSAPRQCGSHMAVRDDGAFEGSVSAGCVEAGVIEACLAAIADKKQRSLAFGVSGEGVFESGLMCGGKIEIFVEPII